MTVDEYRQALDSLTDEQFETFRQRWGGAANRPREECVQEFAYSPTPPQWERIIVFHLQHLGVKGLKTEDEKMLLATQDSAAAAKDSATAAKASANSAAESVRWSRWSAVIAVAAMATTALLQRC